MQSSGRVGRAVQRERRRDNPTTRSVGVWDIFYSLGKYMAIYLDDITATGVRLVRALRQPEVFVDRPQQAVPPVQTTPPASRAAQVQKTSI